MLKRKLLFAVLLTLPLTAQAALQNWKISWQDNQPAGTMVHTMCGVGNATKVEVGSVSSTALSLNFAFGEQGSGVTVQCVIFPTNGATTGPASLEVAGTIPLVLPALVPVLELVP